MVLELQWTTFDSGFSFNVPTQEVVDLSTSRRKKTLRILDIESLQPLMEQL
jgi:hypothetical protein